MTGRRRLVGTSALRKDGPEKSTGAFRYGTDLVMPGMLHARLARAEIAHGILHEVDVSRAAAVPGVRSILTGADTAEFRASRYVKDEPILAVDRIRFRGEPVAAIAADTPEAAAEAARLVEVRVEPLPVIGSVDDALDPAAPLIHPDWSGYDCAPFVRRNGNVLNHAKLRRGDIDRVIASADLVFEHTYDVAMVHQASLEGRVAVARIEADGTAHVWSSHQYPFGLRQDLADILHLPTDRIRVTVTGVGGGFGGKLYAGVEPYCVLLAQRTGRPVKLQYTRYEEFVATSPRMPCRVRVRTAVGSDGTLLARSGTLHYDAGAYAESSPAVISVGLLALPGPYRWEALAIDAYAVYTNKTGCGSFRAPGAPQAVFAGESQLDEIAAALDMDPLELRRRNLVDDGDLGPSGQVLTGVSILQTLDAAADRIGWDEPRPVGLGRGIACCWWTTTGGPSTVTLRLDDRGRVRMITGATEIGTGAVEAGLAQIVADALGVGLDDIDIESADTGSTPYDMGAQGSRTTFQNGNAALAAAGELVGKLTPLAADKLGVDGDRLVVGDGRIEVAGDPESNVTLADLARLAGGSIEAEGSYTAPVTEHDPSTLDGAMLTAFNSPSFATHACEVEVDPGTGTPRLLRYVVAQDVGYVINPAHAAGQVAGGAVQGIGQAMFEELRYEDGAVANPTFTDYKLPTAPDVPDIEVILIERASTHGPFGMKGVGEPGVIAPGAAIANGVADAAGARVRSLPVTAERVAQVIDADRRGRSLDEGAMNGNGPADVRSQFGDELGPAG
jgi:CO/xanthine dehydrogenase Mo-binding subunit